MSLSVLGQRWVMPSPQSAQARLGAALAQATGLPAAVASILAGRGYADAAQANAFLNPRLDMLPDPSTLKDMDKAVQRLAAAIRGHEKIAVFGDYDVDGTCATALLSRYLHKLGITPLAYIPHRLTEGYGPTPEAMETLAQQGTRLLITVDTGTTAHAALEKARQLGMDVIVTDHHQPEAMLPPALAILNPQRADDASALQSLCGSGVVFYLLLALNRHLREGGFFTPDMPEPNLTHSLDLVALATVADVMPLTDINRVLVARGMQQLATWRHRGLAALAGVAGVRDDVSAGSIGFSLAPRLNAAGRVESAQAALNLLMADDDSAALPLAEALNQLNQQRQGVEKAILAEARKQAEEQFTADTLALVLHGESWHPGVVGIVASRIKEAFNRPTFILGGGEEGTFKGSGRSISGFNLGAAVHASKALLLSGGGHAMAAGVSLHRDNLEAFKTSLHTALSGQLAQWEGDATQPLAERLAPKLNIEATVTPVSLNAGLVESLQQLAPFGAANPEPVLALSNVKITYARPVGATQEHLKLRLSDVSGTVNLDAVCFGAMNSALGPELSNSAGRALTLAVTAKPRTFNGKVLMDIHVRDAHTSPITND